MKRLLAMLAAAGALAWANAGPIEPFKAQVPVVPGLSSLSYTMEFRGGKRASVIASGNGSSYMAAYIYDTDGNCVAWDDSGNLKTLDDVAVDWYPRQNGTYTVEVRNSGTSPNECKVYIR
jgi:hypothetical protein